MSACGLQDTPTGVLSFFRPTPHRHRRRGKLDNDYDWNYTPKLLLSLIVTMQYAVARNCRKCAFPGRPNVCPNRASDGLLGPVRLTYRLTVPAPILLSK